MSRQIDNNLHLSREADVYKAIYYVSFYNLYHILITTVQFIDPPDQESSSSLMNSFYFSFSYSVYERGRYG